MGLNGARACRYYAVVAPSGGHSEGMLAEHVDCASLLPCLPALTGLGGRPEQPGNHWVTFWSDVGASAGGLSSSRAQWLDCTPVCRKEGPPLEVISSSPPIGWARQPGRGNLC